MAPDGHGESTILHRGETLPFCDSHLPGSGHKPAPPPEAALQKQPPGPARQKDRSDELAGVTF